ncbi:MAG: hypothetical protein ABIH99_02590 [Candidatus Micrarchaeota archaeon]
MPLDTQTIAEKVGTQWGASVIHGMSWEGVAIISLLIAVFLTTIAYMLSILFGAANMKRWAKGEYFNIAASALLVLGLIIFVNLISAKAAMISTSIVQIYGVTLPEQCTASVEQNPHLASFIFADCYLNEILVCLKTMYLYLFSSNFAVEMMEKTSLSVGGFDTIGGSIMWSRLVNLAHYFTHTITFLIVAIYFLRHLLEFSAGTMISAFLPLGITLRVFPFTRGLGALLIAIAIGLYVVFPITLAVMFAMSGSATLACPIDAGAVSAPNQIYASDPTFWPILWRAGVTSLGVIAGTVVSTVSPLTGVGVFIGSQAAILSLISSYLNFLVLQTFLFPLVSLTVTFTFIRATSQLFGADVAELGKGLMKLI